jgi:hypothetical protein
MWTKVSALAKHHRINPYILTSWLETKKRFVYSSITLYANKIFFTEASEILL